VIVEPSDPTRRTDVGRRTLDVGSGWFGRCLWLRVSGRLGFGDFDLDDSFDSSSLDLDYSFDSSSLDLDNSNFDNSNFGYSNFRSGCFGWRRSSGAWRRCCWFACWWPRASWTQWLGHR